MMNSQSKKLSTAESVAAGLAKSKEPDAKFFTGDMPAKLAAAASRGAMQGSAWAIRDFVLMGGEWGFDPLAISVPTTVIIGASDPLRAVGELYARRLNARLVSVEGGHLGAHTPHGAIAVIDAMASAAIP
jgi:pimeloyl-ACP methyl ester carboxylesterase